MKYDKYIGLPYLTNGRTEAGVDCWGLVRLFYRDELNIDLPSYTDDYSGPDDPSIVALMEEYKDVNWKKQTAAEPGDVCVFNIYGEPCHVGVYVGDSKFMHSREGRDVVIESLDSPKWSKRLEGCYKPDTNKQIQVVGAPHPLKTGIFQDWTVAGTTVRDFVNFTKEKYKVSDRFSSKLLVVVDGVKIPMDQWDTTVLQQGQTIAYKAVPEGKDAFRMVLLIALIVVANVYGAQIGSALGFTGEGATVAGYTEAGAVTTTGKIVGTMAINMAGMALINAVFPIRPGTVNDPGQGRGLNMFTGASNQANKFGAIPVVLGKVRVTGLLGAIPYIETTPDSSILNLLIVWGFGPLQVDPASICVGLTPLSKYYPDNYPVDAPKYYTTTGIPNEDQSGIARIYPYNIEQKILEVELKNNQIDGNAPAEYRFTKKADSIAVGLTFPEGMREVVLTGKDAGKINEAMAGIEIQVAKYNPTNNTVGSWSPIAPYSIGYWSGGTTDSRAFVTSEPADFSYLDPYGSKVTLYQYVTLAMMPGGGIAVYHGTATDNPDAEPSAGLIASYKNGTFANLVGDDTSTYSRFPTIPNGNIKLYTICLAGGGAFRQTNHLVENGLSYTGLALTLDPHTTYNSQTDSYVGNGILEISVGSGKVFVQMNEAPTPGTTQTIFTSRQFTGATATSGQNTKNWNQFLIDYGVWNGTGTLTTITQIVNFPYTGYYLFEGCSDDSGAIYLDGSLLIQITGFTDVTNGLVYIEKGNHTVQLTGNNSGGQGYATACRINYTANSGMNALNANNTGIQLYFGTGGFFSKRKDAFNFTYKINSLPHDYYAIRVRRTTDDTSELTPDAHKYFKAILFDVTAYSSKNAAGVVSTPIIDPPDCYISKSAIRVQSTNKVNGSIDGVNAMVQTMAPTWDSVSKTWNFTKLAATNNPASLFIYVLMHKANAYRIEEADKTISLDLATLGSWYEFCNSPAAALGRTEASLSFTYNDIITGTKSVMEVLRDITAAGMASPAFVDGKWTVIIDRPRAYTSQYFTTHNSWGFESTKLLPKIPDGFRVSFPDESRAYQVNEIMIYNYGKSKETAKLFESISLPGITRKDQVEFFAKWHLAQLKLRPEVYTLNTDFEYLVCSRGDLVKVTHDIPKWGTSSGRISSIVNSTTLKLSESVYLESTKQYNILIRTNHVDGTTKVLQSVTKQFTVATSGDYDQITLSSAIVTADNVEVDNLYMLGEVGKETQQLIVVSIEPMANMSAKLTLVDYSPTIYTADATKDLLVYDPNITGETIPIIINTIRYAPTITNVDSDSARSEQISTGIYQNVLLVSYTHPSDLSKSAEKIEVQVVPSDTILVDTSLEGITTVNKDSSGATITGLVTGGLYKLRARYTNAARTIIGPWSDTYYAKNTGNNKNRNYVNDVDMYLSDTYIVANVTSSFVKPNDFKTFEYRFIKDEGQMDFWDLDPVVNNIIVVQSLAEARINLIDVPPPRISDGGVTYRVACRAIDNNNNYSTTSAFGEVVVTTIT